MKQKRILTHFEVTKGLDRDDFVKNLETVAIRYKLNRQKKLRIFWFKIGLHWFESDPKGVRAAVWRNFKRKLNIVG